MKWYVLGFCFNGDESKVVLISKLKPQWQVGLLNGVGGKIERNESSLEAMYREFEEETGIKTKPFYANEKLSDWTHFATMRGPDWCVTCFSITWNDLDHPKYGVQSMTDEQVGVYSVDVLPKTCVSNIPWLVNMAKDKDLIGRPLEILYPGSTAVIM